jgi:urease accessory protein
MGTPAALLLLADGRFPTGGHAHSGGLEATVAAGTVRDIASLGAFLRGRLHTTGIVTAALAAAACAGADLAAVDAAADARAPAPALRRTSRAQGRALLRAARLIWPGVSSPHLLSACRPFRGSGDAPPEDAWGELAAVHPEGPHQPVAFGAVTGYAGLTPEESALASAYAAISGPATAAVRLLGLDPYAVHGVLSALGPHCEQVATQASAAAQGPLHDLPAGSAPLLDIGATVHATWEVRLFAS